MEREKMIEGIKKAIDTFRMEEEEQMDGKWYVNSSYICAELSNGNIVDNVVRKYIPDGAVVLTREELEELKHHEEKENSILMH